VDCFTGQSTTAKDYRVPFSLASGFFLILIIFIVFFLDVKVEKQDRKLTLKQEFGWVASPGVAAFYALLLAMGVQWGAEQTFLAVFAVEELSASLTLLGYCATANQVCGLIT